MYGNLNRKIYIDLNIEHLLASNFTESLKLSSASRLFCAESREIQFSISTRYPKYRKREI